MISVIAEYLDTYNAALTLAGMLGLALGIDYSLVAVQRFREELARGRTVLDAVTITGSTANRAILLSGSTVVVALAGLMLIPTNALYAITIGAGLVAIVSVCAALTLLPAVLRLLGTRVNKGRVPTAHPGQEPKGWTRLARVVISRPAIAAAIGVAVLVVLALPATSIRLANAGPDSLPADFVVRESGEIVQREFGHGQASTLIAIENASAAPEAVQALADAVEADPGYEGTSVDWHGDAAFIDTHDAYASDDPRLAQAIKHLRSEIIPAALDGTGATAYVGGTNAAQYDELQLFAKNSWKVVVAVLGASFLILLVVFRSIVIPIKAIVLNLLGVAAAFGALVAAFQFGWGRFLGLPEASAISPYMPVFIFALVFGLSMDYHVFLLSRIKERYDATRDNERAIVEGLARTGPLITGAAVIMVAVFGGFAGAAIPELAQWGFGLAAAVLIDATIIRVLLVPAAMAWLGRANWYLPRWLQWLPKTSIEVPVEPAAEVDEDRGEREPALV
jgi:RND superfamily putative drug exporter